MGSILQAEDCKIGRTVAVKIMLSEMGISAGFEYCWYPDHEAGLRQWPLCHEGHPQGISNGGTICHCPALRSRDDMARNV